MADGFLYCANLRCPHRVRIKAPAEFLAPATSCSDCGAALVDSLELATQGTRPSSVGPYRAKGAVIPIVDRGERTFDDRKVGMVCLGFGLLVSLGTYLFAGYGSGRDGSYIVAWGPMVYGVYRLLRAKPAPPPSKKKAASKSRAKAKPKSALSPP